MASTRRDSHLRHEFDKSAGIVTQASSKQGHSAVGPMGIIAVLTTVEQQLQKNLTALSASVDALAQRQAAE